MDETIDLTGFLVPGLFARSGAGAGAGAGAGSDSDGDFPFIPPVLKRRRAGSVDSKVIQTSPALRKLAMDAINDAIRLGLKATESEVYGYLTNDEVIGSGSYGEVSKGNIRAGGGRLMVRLPTGKLWEATVALKRTLQTNDIGDPIPHKVPVRISCMDAPDGEFGGFSLPHRETLISTLLNRLVLNGNTPHIGLYYRVVTVSDKMQGLASFMELGDRSLRDELKRSGTILNPKMEVLDVKIAIFQIVQGLIAAGSAFGFSHNDVTTANVVMSKVESQTWRYYINGKAYDVPNRGRLWKIIDPGLSTMNTFNPAEMTNLWRDRNMTTDRFFHPDHLKYKYNRAKDVSIYLWDIALLLVDIAWITGYTELIKHAIELAEVVTTMFGHPTALEAHGTGKHGFPGLKHDHAIMNAWLAEFGKEFISKGDVVAQTFNTEKKLEITALLPYESHFLEIVDGELQIRKGM